MEKKPICMLRVQEVCQRTGFSKSHLYRLVEESKFPAPVRLGRRIIAWVEEEVDNWLRMLIEQRASEG